MNIKAGHTSKGPINGTTFRDKEGLKNMLIAELFILCILFWAICYLNTGSDDKNIKSYSSYPNEVQKIVKKNPVLQSKIKTASPIVSFVSNILIFGAVLFIFGLFVKEDGFMPNFTNLLILGQCLNAFDFLIIDMLWWRNSKRIRFAGTEDKRKLYSNPKKHFVSFLKGIVVFLIVAVIDGLILTVI